MFSHLSTTATQEYPDDTASEISIDVHSQDEDKYSTDYNTMSPPRIYHIPMSPCKPMLTRPSYITATNDTQDQHFTADSELPISDTETENSDTLQTQNTTFPSLQDHKRHLPRPPCNPRPTNQHK